MQFLKNPWVISILSSLGVLLVLKHVPAAKNFFE